MKFEPLDILNVLNSPQQCLDFVLPGLPLATVGNLVAPGGTGKTQFLLQLAVCKSLGIASFDGLFPASAPEAVLFIAAEEPEIVITQRLHAIIDSLIDSKIFLDIERSKLVEMLASNLRIFPLSGRNVRLIERGQHTEVVAEIEIMAEDCRLVIIDPLRRLHDGDENNSLDMTSLVQALEQIAIRCKTAVLVAHHTSKQSGQSKSELQGAGRGSSAFVDGVRWQANLSLPSSQIASELNISPSDAHSYVRFEITKMNYGAAIPAEYLCRSKNGVLSKFNSHRAYVKQEKNSKGRKHD